MLRPSKSTSEVSFRCGSYINCSMWSVYFIPTSMCNEWQTEGGGSLRSVSGIVRAPLSSLLSPVSWHVPLPPEHQRTPPLPGVDHIRYNYYVEPAGQPARLGCLGLAQCNQLLRVLLNVRRIISEYLIERYNGEHPACLNQFSSWYLFQLINETPSLKLYRHNKSVRIVFF